MNILLASCRLATDSRLTCVLDSVECAPAAATLMSDFVFEDFLQRRKIEDTWFRWRLVLVKPYDTPAESSCIKLEILMSLRAAASVLLLRLIAP